MSDRIQIALDGLSEMESARLANNLRFMYSAIMNVDDSQQDVYALGFPLMDLIPILEQVAHDLYGYPTQATVTAELSELRARVGENTRERYCLECSEAAEHHSSCDYARSASVYHSADLEVSA